MKNISDNCSFFFSFLGLICSTVIVAGVCGQNIAQSPATQSPATWKTLAVEGKPTARHEAAFVEHDGQLYLIGGRRVNPVDVFDPVERKWNQKRPSPVELHHFQPVSIDDKIIFVGAMSGGWPNEQSLRKVVVYSPSTDQFTMTHYIPESRRRGAAGAVEYDGKIYVVGGITNGHMDGTVAWFDEYDPNTGEWKIMPDAPHARDHFQAVVVDDKLYAVGGRETLQKENKGFELTIADVDVFDFKTNQWLPVGSVADLPTPRAGNMAIAVDGKIFVGGGESGLQIPAHHEVEIFDPSKNSWSRGNSLEQGRHGTGFAIVGNNVYTASGCGNRGGEPELETIESISKLLVNQRAKKPVAVLNSNDDIYPHEKVTLSFNGPELSESDTENPFTNYRLCVRFTNGDENMVIRGFYAADGQAAESGADSGHVWQCRFAPPSPGVWKYEAELSKGDWIAIDDNAAGESIAISDAAGTFDVQPWPEQMDPNTPVKSQNQFRRGRLYADGSNYRFTDSGGYWLKGGANSPENLLGYVDFDGTYRMSGNDRDGEAKATDRLHKFEPHLADWNEGDPTWRGGKGKSLIGAINYLSSTGMNSVYFLTMNITGDGKDVWPYADPDDFTRFDCSKLDQWEVVFEHMQRNGLACHFITQETENEKLLDDGDTGQHRKLYYRELISRFAHHPSVVWNLGEENGPASFSPNGQTTVQEKSMADYLSQNDPYGNTVLIHTHSELESQDHILDPLLGHKSLDGLSLQVSKPKNVHRDVLRWGKSSADASRPWVITMDEIGPAHTGSRPDADNPTHDDMRGDVLWGSLMAGGRGVEWYFGYKFAHNDLVAEDWRSRAELWRQTSLALDFFNKHTAFWKMQPADELLMTGTGWCFAEQGNSYVVYRKPGQGNEILKLDLTGATGEFSVAWYSPIRGGELQAGAVSSVAGGSVVELGVPPNDADSDWAALIKKSNK